MMLLQTVRARSQWVIAVFATTVVLSLIISLVLPRIYVAQVSLVLDSKGTDPITGAVVPTLLLPGYLPTQVEMIQSHSTALRVVDKLHLDVSPEYRDGFLDEADGKGSIRDYIADRLLRKLEVTPSRDSNVIMVGYPRRDPDSSAEFANAFADAYIQTALHLKMDPAGRQSSWFESQIASQRAAVEDAQRKLSEFQQSHKIVATDDKLDVENSRLADLSTQLVTAQTAMYEARTRLDASNHAAGQGQLDQSPEARLDPALQGIKADLARAEAEEAQIAQRYDRNHPLHRSAAAQVSTLREKLSKELRVMRGSLSQNSQITQKKVSELQSAVDQQKGRILQMRRQRDTLDVLNRDVDNSQKAYDTALQRSSEVRLESRLDQSNVAVLSPAVPPLKPARPILLLNVALGIVAGVLLSIGTAVALESFDRRIRSPLELKEFTGLALIAEVSGLLREPLTSLERPVGRALRGRGHPALGSA